MQGEEQDRGVSVMMRAVFQAEGVESPRFTFEGEHALISVELETDGRYVRVRLPMQSPDAHPTLTPRGWAQIADSAALFVKEANAAYERMGATR